MGRKSLLVFVSILFVLMVGYLLYAHYSGKVEPFDKLNHSVVDRTFANYGDKVKVASAQFDIDPAYLLALIALESSGRKIVPHRFEPHVFRKLKEVKAGERKSYEHVTTYSLRELNTAGLKNLASSWGPFQLMGYKCFEMNVKVADIRGPRSVFHGAKWIRGNYGDLLDEGRFKDAFHMHNTGTPYPTIGGPRTHSKDYVPRGLKYMEEFRVKLD